VIFIGFEGEGRNSPRERDAHSGFGDFRRFGDWSYLGRRAGSSPGV
jgi:hypothetical protein